MFHIPFSFLKISFCHVCPKSLEMKFLFFFQKFTIQKHTVFVPYVPFFLADFQILRQVVDQAWKTSITGFCQSAFLFPLLQQFFCELQNCRIVMKVSLLTLLCATSFKLSCWISRSFMALGFFSSKHFWEEEPALADVQRQSFLIPIPFHPCSAASPPRILDCANITLLDCL